MIPAVVLAAGQSSRMGRSKALLPYGPLGQVSFLQQIVSSLSSGGISDILVVGRPDDERLVAAVLALPTPARFVANPHHRKGQLTSIVAAIHAVDHPGVRGLLVMPVDIPTVRVETFERLLQAFTGSPTSIVRPAYRGRHGHPVIFDRSSFEPLRRADPEKGAKVVLQSHAERVLNVDVDDKGVLIDIDSIEEYVAVFGATPESFDTAT